jgi:hypothetical protein
MQRPTFYPDCTAELFLRCENRDRVYDLVVFDAWLCNEDRHSGNLLVRRSTHARTERYLLLLNDHGHCLLRPYVTVEELPQMVDNPPGYYVQLQFIRDAVRDSALLDAALSGIESISEPMVGDVMAAIPEELLGRLDRDPLQDFLIARRNRLRQAFRNGIHCFPSLGGDPL